MFLLEHAAKKLGRKPPYTTPRQRELHAATYYDGGPFLAQIVTGGARAGKSQFLADVIFSRHLSSDLILVLGPDFEQVRHEMRYTAALLKAIGNFDDQGTSMPTAPGPWTIKTRTGCTIVSRTSTDVEKIAGIPPDLVVMVEAGQQPQEAFQRAIERAMEKDGQVLAAGTLENSQPWFAEKFTEYQAANDERGISMNLPTWSNIFVFPGGEQDPKFLKFANALGGIKSDYVQTRLYGLPKKPEGLVHPEFQQRVHANLAKWPLPYDEVLAQVRAGKAFIQLWIDPGYAGGYDIGWFTTIDGLVFGLKETFARGVLSEQLISHTVTDPLYQYVSHLVMDIAGRSHGAAAMQSPKEQWIAKTHLPVLDGAVSIADGITRTASFLIEDPILKHPKLFLHPSMKNAIWEYTQGYRYPVDSEGKVIGEKPIDKHNHAAKAIAYGLIANFGLVQARTVHGAGKRSVPGWKKKRRK